MMMSVWLVAVVIGTALAAPQDFNFKKSVVVRSSDHPVETSHIIHAAPPPPTVQVVHKNFDPEAHDRFWNSGSGQALDNAGAQLFAGLGDAASGLGDFLSNLFGRSRQVVVVDKRSHDAY